MAQHKRQPTEIKECNKEEKRKLTDAIEKDDTDTIQQIIQHGSVDVNAYINWTTRTTIIGRWHYTALHYAVDQDKLNCVKLLLQLGASLTITDYYFEFLSGISRKNPLQRAVEKNKPSIVHYFVKECKQNISEFNQKDQNKICSMIQRQDCIIAKENVTSYYAEPASLPITSLLANLQGKGVITVEEKEKIKAKPEETDRMQYFLDHVIVPSLDDSAINKFKGFLEVMKESGDSKLYSVAVKLGLGVTEPTLPSKGTNVSTEVNYHRLLWQELNKNFGNATTIFVMAVGKQLSSFDYDITSGHAELAAQKTFELVNHTIPCATNYSSGGSLISVMWERLLQGKGPRAGPEHQPAFEKAKRALFVDYDNHKPTDLYQDYLDKEIALKQKELQIEEECQNQYGDQWKVKFDKTLKVSKEYIEFQRAVDVVRPHLDAIEVWKHGPLVHNLNHMKQVLEENAMSVIDYSKSCLKYYRVSLQPANWYQWFDSLHQQEGVWTQINVDSKNDDADQATLYTKLGGSVTTYHSLDKHSDVKISFKVRAVQINRPWLDLSVLNNKSYTIYGEEPGSWSTGELDADNKGSFPLLSTQMIVAKDIKVTASTEMEQEAITDTCSLFGVQSNSCKTINNNSIELKGTQVIGYACTLIPKFPQ